MMHFPYPNNFPGELRLLARSDAEELFALVDSNRQQLRQWLPWVDQNSSIRATKEFLKRCREQYLNNLGFNTGIWFERKLAGVIGYHSIDWPNKTVMIGYWLAERYQGKGLVTEACRILVDHAFSSFKLNRVEIRCATGNAKSCAIPQRLGFVHEGIIRDGEWLYEHYVDLHVYGMLARDWRLKREAHS